MKETLSAKEIKRQEVGQHQKQAIGQQAFGVQWGVLTWEGKDQMFLAFRVWEALGDTQAISRGGPKHAGIGDSELCIHSVLPASHISKFCPTLSPSYLLIDKLSFKLRKTGDWQPD